MQVNVAGLRRNLKNIAHNYSDAQKKVREATSNDPWGPSSTLMAEIADLTYNVIAFTEIMQMIWKRLNDHGRNWRHVYKALVLLEYLIKTGSEKVGQQCKENIYAIQTLKDFQYLEEGRDQGQNVREKAKQLVNLLKDDERLRNERARALKAKERFAQTASAFGSDGGLDTPTSPKFPSYKGEWSSRDSAELARELEVARPQTAGEEELQLQLALAMSREEAEQEEQKRKSDDVRLQLALSQSQQDFKTTQDKGNVVDLFDVNIPEATAQADPWGLPNSPRAQTSPWRANSASSPTNQAPAPVDPWLPTNSPIPKLADPWSSKNKNVQNQGDVTSQNHDPWSPTSQSSSTDLDEFDAITNRNRTTSPNTNGNHSDPFELNLLGDALPSAGPSPSTGATKKTPQSFLGENSALVNLDNLVTSKPTNTTNIANPFSEPQNQQPPRQVFNTPPPKPPTINQMKQQPFMGSTQFSTSPVPFVAGGGNLGTSPSFGANGQFGSTGTNFTAPVNVTPDPWTPVPHNNANQTNNSPWTKSGGEQQQQQQQANPFLS